MYAPLKFYASLKKSFLENSRTFEKKIYALFEQNCTHGFSGKMIEETMMRVLEQFMIIDWKKKPWDSPGTVHEKHNDESPWKLILASLKKCPPSSRQSQPEEWWILSSSPPFSWSHFNLNVGYLKENFWWVLERTNYDFLNNAWKNDGIPWKIWFLENWLLIARRISHQPPDAFG